LTTNSDVVRRRLRAVFGARVLTFTPDAEALRLLGCTDEDAMNVRSRSSR
jgi:hypothetical protein